MDRFGMPARLFDRRAHSPENLSSVIQKEFCNTIPPKADKFKASRHFAKVPGMDMDCPTISKDNLGPILYQWARRV